MIENSDGKNQIRALGSSNGLGTTNLELRRLEDQHAIWRDHALASWHRAGFGTGQRLLDLGCGPGFASFDLARLMATLDHLNHRLRPDAVKFAALGPQPHLDSPGGVLLPALHHPLARVTHGDTLDAIGGGLTTSDRPDFPNLRLSFMTIPMRGKLEPGCNCP